MTHISVETIRVIKTEVWDEMYTALILCLIVVYAVYLVKNGTKGFWKTFVFFLCNKRKNTILVTGNLLKFSDNG